MAGRTLRRAAVAGLAAGAALALAPSAVATFPGDNGLIAFSRDGDIWVINPDGTGEKRLTSGAEHRDVAPEWSPDGKEIFFARTGGDGPHIYRMKADGTGIAWVRRGETPQLSGDGSQLAFLDIDSTTSNPAVFTAGRDGSNPKVLDADENLNDVDDWAPTHSLILATFRDGDAIFGAKSPSESSIGWKIHDDELHFSNDDPSWSPDGSTIAFATFPVGISSICFGEPTCPHPTVGIRAMDLGGGGLKTIRQGLARHPVWAPDGHQIAFVEGPFGSATIMTMGVNGTGPRTLTKGDGPDWQPLPRTAPPPSPTPETKTVTVTVQAPPPPPVEVVKVVTRVVTTDGKVCPIPASRRKLTLTIRATRGIKKGTSVKVRIDLRGGDAKVAVPRGKPFRAVAG